MGLHGGKPATFGLVALQKYEKFHHKQYN